MSAFTEFLSHPIEEKKNSLLQHSIDVATKTQKLLSKTKFQNEKLGYYAGLLHDLGKLNPYYQLLFGTTRSERELVGKDLELKYEPVHSPFSSWIADKLLERHKDIDYRTLDKITLLIYGHHSKLRKSLGELQKGDRFKASQRDMLNNLRRFAGEALIRQEFGNLPWSDCLDRFPDPISFDISLGSTQKNEFVEFLELSFAYSSLLQADRGSFLDWVEAIFSQNIETTKLVKSASKLSSIRTSFQYQVISNYKYDNPITIINAPTGIGKTKIFLDLIKNYKQVNNVERIFYFSPLLALTEDFERKLLSIINDLESVLVYNHLFAGSLEEKRLLETGRLNESKWVFENESFNKEFVITTTQRLLITLYSNRQRAKLKLASFRNSLLVVDEVQTIPKYILRNLITMLQKMFEYMGTRTILVSATIPHELGHIPSTRVSPETISSYLRLTMKKIEFVNLSLSQVEKNNTLLMANTRRKAAKIFTDIATQHSDAMYMSTGIRKSDRANLLQKIDNMTRTPERFVLVSTQVVEAGVDISFNQIYREVAPLDSIIQVMGRLNREGDNEDAKIVIYEYDGDHRPYSQLEFNDSVQILKNVKDSFELYSYLPKYYEQISEKNNLYKKYATELNHYMSKLDFEATWEFINRHVFLEEERDPIFIPDIDEWDEVKHGLMDKEIARTQLRKYGYLTATLPKSVDKLGIKHLLDPDLLELNILLPNKEHLSEVYDPILGTDKWLIQQ